MTTDRRIRCGHCGWAVVLPPGYTVTITVNQTRKGQPWCAHEVREVKP